MKMAKGILGLSFVQFLIILVVYMLNPNVIWEQMGALALAAITSVGGPSILFSAKGRAKIVGVITEGLYMVSIAFLFSVILYNIVI